MNLVSNLIFIRQQLVGAVTFQLTTGITGINTVTAAGKGNYTEED